MNRGGLLADILTPEAVAKLENVSNSDVHNFVDLIGILGLDPKVDLRYCDFSGVDFTDCDLRGFDFTGSDLRGATGKNCTVDATTILVGADVDSPLFEPARARQSIFERLPELGSEYARIKRSEWKEQALWVMDSLKAGIKNRVERQALAMSLYFDATDGYVRNTILNVVIFGSSKEARLEFINNIVVDRNISPDLVASALHQVGRILKNDPDIAGVLLHIAESKDTPLVIVNAAARAALQNKHVLKHSRRAYLLVQQLGDAELENLYIRAFAEAIGIDHATAVSEGRPHGGVNFSETIDMLRVKQIAANIWRARQANDAAPPSERRSIFKDLYSRPNFEKRVAELLSDLVDRGLRLKLKI